MAEIKDTHYESDWGHAWRTYMVMYIRGKFAEVKDGTVAVRVILTYLRTMHGGKQLSEVKCWLRRGHEAADMKHELIGIAGGVASDKGRAQELMACDYLRKHGELWREAWRKLWQT